MQQQTKRLDRSFQEKWVNYNFTARWKKTFKIREKERTLFQCVPRNDPKTLFVTKLKQFRIVKIERTKFF